MKLKLNEPAVFISMEGDTIRGVWTQPGVRVIIGSRFQIAPTGPDGETGVLVTTLDHLGIPHRWENEPVAIDGDFEQVIEGA